LNDVKRQVAAERDDVIALENNFELSGDRIHYNGAGLNDMAHALLAALAPTYVTEIELEETDIEPVRIGSATLTGDLLRFPSDGDRWKVYDRVNRLNVCLSHRHGSLCRLDPGDYALINVTRNTRTLFVYSEGP